jgi:hypothetical protein
MMGKIVSLPAMPSARSFGSPQRYFGGKFELRLLDGLTLPYLQNIIKSEKNELEVVLMAAEQYIPRPYEDLNFLSFASIERAVKDRVKERAQALIETEFPLPPGRLEELWEDEWKNAMLALRESPQAREHYMNYIENALGTISQQKLKEEKDILIQMGVQEKGL